MTRRTIQMIKKNLISAIFGISLLYSLSACGSQAAVPKDRTEQTRQESKSTEQTSGDQKPDGTHNLQPKGGETATTESVSDASWPSGRVPFFQDDTGKNTQLADGWLYGYWDTQLCRVDTATGASKILYEAKSPQKSFCIHNGYLYFLVEKQIDYPDLRAGHKADLHRMKCDGSDSRLLAEDIDLSDTRYCRMNVYDDILYLTSPHGKLEDCHFFRLLQDGSVQETAACDTLYGTLPQGYQDACGQYQYQNLPNLPSCMTYLGYVFICDEGNRLYRYIPETGQKQKIQLPDPPEYRHLFLTNQALVYALADTWYAVSLDDVEQVTEIGKLDCTSIRFWDESGLYSAEQKDNDSSLRLTRLNWNGEVEILHYYIEAPEPGTFCNILYSDGTWLYYSRLDKGDGVIYRIPLEGKEEGKPFYLYYDNPLKDVCTQESFDFTFTVKDSQMEGHFSLSKVFLTEETKAADRINAFLQEQYNSQEAYITEQMENVRSAAAGNEQKMVFSSGTLIDSSMYTSVDYIDDHYIGFTIGSYQYMQGAAHGVYGYSQYVFDRTTGKRIQITDVVKNTPSEICAIIAPYVAAGSDWGTEEEGWETIILGDGRFYLTPEGIGIHFDVYEMTCYAAGALDIVVPYEEFNMDPAIWN